MIAAVALLLLGTTQNPLQSRIDQAQPGDTIRVAAGIYRGQLRIERRVVLVGQPGAVIDAGRRGSAVVMAADSAQLKGLTVRNSGRSLDNDDAAVRLEGCDYCVVSGVTVDRSLHGIYLLESHMVRVAHNTVLGDTALAEGRRGNGIHLFNSVGTEVIGNRIRFARDGIYFASANQTLVEQNEVSHVRYGLHYMYSHDNVFRRNSFRRNAAGAAIMVSQRIRLEENIFAEHIGYRAYGLLLQTAEDITVERNRIEGNLTGLFIDASVRNTFRANVIAGNGIGIDLLASSEQNDFTENAIFENRLSVRKVLGAGENEWAVAGRGNYWGTPDVFDLDGDGRGERAHRVGDAFSALASRRPVLDIFSGTLAAAAFNWAEEAFPVFGVARVEDPAPLSELPVGVRRERAPQRGLVFPILAAGSLPLVAFGFARRRARAGVQS